MQGIRAVVTRDRLLRLAAFLIDMLFLGLILALCDLILHRPDFGQVRAALDSVAQIADYEARQAQMNMAMDLFQDAYLFSVAVWLGCEVVFQLIFNGQTVGKKICGLRVVSTKPGEGRLKTSFRFTVRSLVKGVFLILFQGFPILISWFYILANPANRAGYDLFLSTRVVSSRQ